MDSVRGRGRGAGPAAGRGAGLSGRGAVLPAGIPAQAYVTPSDLPDYYPPFTIGTARADADGNVWVRANPTAGGAVGIVYDVIGRNGGLVDRVQLPAGNTLVGFGVGVVYLSSGAGLSKVRIH